MLKAGSTTVSTHTTSTLVVFSHFLQHSPLNLPSLARGRHRQTELPPFKSLCSSPLCPFLPFPAHPPPARTGRSRNEGRVPVDGLGGLAADSGAPAGARRLILEAPAQSQLPSPHRHDGPTGPEERTAHGTEGRTGPKSPHLCSLPQSRPPHQWPPSQSEHFGRGL